NPNNKYFIEKLRNQQKLTYNKYYGIAVLAETRWNSYYMVAISLLKSQQALKKASDNYTSIEGFDEEEEVMDSSSLKLADIENKNKKILEINYTVHPAVDSNTK
ncbi:2745_t:CDS:2, partial [Dentiscutata erythropus]